MTAALIRHSRRLSQALFFAALTAAALFVSGGRSGFIDETQLLILNVIAALSCLQIANFLAQAALTAVLAVRAKNPKLLLSLLLPLFSAAFSAALAAAALALRQISGPVTL